jgi:DNA-binding MarR family transcriptional regulator
MDTTENFDLAEFLPYLLNMAAEQAGRGFQKYYKARYGMVRTEWRVVYHLGLGGDMTARDICNRARTHKTKVSRAVAALEARRFITRMQVEADRRQEMLSLTPAGRAAYRDLSAMAKTFDDKLMAQFTAAEQAVLRKCLKRLAG